MRGRQLLERRGKMLRQVGQGVSLNETVDVLSREYEISENALYKDWQNRNKWASDIVGLDDPDSFVMEIVDFLKWLRQRSTLEVLQGDSTANRIGAIRTAVDVIKTLYTIAQASGKIKKPEGLIERDISVSAWNLGVTESPTDKS